MLTLEALIIASKLSYTYMVAHQVWERCRFSCAYLACVSAGTHVCITRTPAEMVVSGPNYIDIESWPSALNSVHVMKVYCSVVVCVLLRNDEHNFLWVQSHSPVPQSSPPNREVLTTVLTEVAHGQSPPVQTYKKASLPQWRPYKARNSPIRTKVEWNGHPVLCYTECCDVWS